MTYAFQADSKTFLEFFKRVKERNVKDEIERIKILLELVKEGYKISISQSSKTPEEWVKAYSKHGKVLWVKPATLEGGTENGDSNGL